MQNYRIALLAGGLLIGTTAAATAQQLATAVPPPRDEIVVFTEQGSHGLSPTAISTVRTAATKARPVQQIMLIGHPENIAAVKGELVRQGVPADTIVTRREVAAPLPKAPDGLSDPIDRRVEIRF